MLSVLEWFVLVLQCDAFVLIVLSDEPKRTKGEGGYLLLVISLLAVARRLFCFGSLVILDVTCCYLWLFSLYKNSKNSKNSC